MDTQKINARNLRKKQADVLNQIVHKETNFVVTRHDKETAALISLDKFYLLQKVIEYLEDEQDVADAKKAIKEVKKHGTKLFKQLAKELEVNKKQKDSYQ